MVNIDELVSALETTRVTTNGVSFAGKALKLDTAADAKPVLDAINACTELQFLNLEGNTLGVDAAEEVAKCLERHPEFKQALWKDMFTGRMKTEIPKALEFLGNGLVVSGSRLTELDLSDNAFGPIGVQGLASLLRSSSCYCLEVLKLNNNGLGTEGGKLLSKALLDCYKSSKEQGKPLSLKVFIAGRNRLENNGAKALAEVFKTIGTLEEIAMPQNGIYHVGIKALSEAFQCNQNLQILNLNDNTIGPDGAQSLSIALRKLPSIRDINFGDCLLKTKGAKFLAEGLRDNTTLEELTLGFNEIKIEGGLELVNAMKNKSKLKNLVLDGNHFGANGKKQIQEQLKEIGKVNTLGSLSEDESEDSESESGSSENEDSETEEEEEEEADKSKEAEESKEDLQNKSLIFVPTHSAVTIEDFLAQPTTNTFLGLGENRNSIIANEFKKLLAANVENYIVHTMKIAALGANPEKEIREDVINCCELLFKELFTNGHKTEQIPLITNSILVNLGLIKSEDKKNKPTWNVDGCFIVLKNLVKKNYFPEATRNCMKLFVQKDCKDATTARKELANELN